MQDALSMEQLAAEHEALLQFIYLAPVGLIQARIDGEIVLVNPLCARLLLPLAPAAALDNLFTALQPLLPDLAGRVAGFAPRHGLVCDGLPLAVPDGRVLALTLLKLDEARLMAVLAELPHGAGRTAVAAVMAGSDTAPAAAG